ncbi:MULTISPECIES: hypothetical protein [Amycolatopsis]|uniref:MFS transporter n=1 Tax=Amycolatopsis albidoflavus TaxID=102226 RepID=A0ABW5HQ17_9PSEU
MSPRPMVVRSVAGLWTGSLLMAGLAMSSVAGLWTGPLLMARFAMRSVAGVWTGPLLMAGLAMPSVTGSRRVAGPVLTAGLPMRPVTGSSRGLLSAAGLAIARLSLWLIAGPLLAAMQLAATRSGTRSARTARVAPKPSARQPTEITPMITQLMLK